MEGWAGIQQLRGCYFGRSGLPRHNSELCRRHDFEKGARRMAEGALPGPERDYFSLGARALDGTILERIRALGTYRHGGDQREAQSSRDERVNGFQLRTPEADRGLHVTLRAKA